MSLDQAKDHIRQLTDSEFDHIRLWMYDSEQPRRRQEYAKRLAQAEVVAEMAESGQVRPAKSTLYADALAGKRLYEWVDPEGVLAKMYFPDRCVLRNGRVFCNALGVLNGSDPETGDGWEDVTEEVAAATAKPDPATRPNGSAELPWPWRVGRTVSKGHHVEHEGVVYRAAESYLIQEGDDPYVLGDVFVAVEV